MKTLSHTLFCPQELLSRFLHFFWNTFIFLLALHCPLLSQSIDAFLQEIWSSLHLRNKSSPPLPQTHKHKHLHTHIKNSFITSPASHHNHHASSSLFLYIHYACPLLTLMLAAKSKRMLPLPKTRPRSIACPNIQGVPEENTCLKSIWPLWTIWILSTVWTILNNNPSGPNLPYGFLHKVFFSGTSCIYFPHNFLSFST